MLVAAGRFVDNSRASGFRRWQMKENQAMEAPAPRPTGSRYRFKLKTLIVLTAIVAIAIAWQSNRIRPQAEAVAELDKVRIWVQYDEPAKKAWFMPWADRWLGKDFLHPVVGVTSVNGNFSDGAFRLLDRLPLEWIFISSSSTMTDEGVQRLLGAHPELKSVTILQCGHVSEAGIAHLSDLKKLERVCFDNWQTSGKVGSALKSRGVLVGGL
jgi:hypothetical protein